MEPPDQVVHVTEATSLRTVAEHRERLVLEGLAHEGWDRTPVVRPHSRPVRIEDANDRGIHALLAVVRHRHCLAVALRLVIDAARADRVDVPPVALRLRMHLRVAVDLARRGEQEAGALPLRQTERVMRPVRADLQRVERLAQVVDRACERGEVVDEIDGPVDLDRVDDVVIEEDEIVVAQMLQIFERAGLEVVHADDAEALLEQVLAEMRAEEPGPAGDDRHGHGRDVIQGAGGLTQPLRRATCVLGYALWMTIDPPAIACGPALSMSAGGPALFPKPTPLG